MRINGNDTESWNYKKRDIASLVAFFGPIVMVIGLIGTWSVLQYRVDKIELRLDKVETRHEKIIDKLDAILAEQNRRSGIFDMLQIEADKRRRRREQ